MTAVVQGVENGIKTIVLRLEAEHKPNYEGEIGGEARIALNTTLRVC